MDEGFVAVWIILASIILWAWAYWIVHRKR